MIARAHIERHSDAADTLDVMLLNYIDDSVFVSERDNILQLISHALTSFVSTLLCFKEEKSVHRREECSQKRRVFTEEKRVHRRGEYSEYSREEVL